MTPRLCVVSALYHPNLGGLGRQAQLLAERLAADGVELFVLARRMTGMGEGGFAPGVPVTRVWTPFPGVHILEDRSLKNLLISLCFSLGCLALLVARRRRYDVVHFHGASVPLLLCLPVLKFLGKKVVAKVAAANLGTEAGSLGGRYGGLGTRLARLTRRVDAFVAISEEIRQGLLADGVAPEQIHRIANFVDPVLFRPPMPGERDAAKERRGYGGQTLVLYAGRLVERKGVAFMLEAWRDVSAGCPEARLVLLGEGPLLGALTEQARRLGITGSVRFAGRVDDVPGWLRAADVFVLPSLQEGLPNALLEAMASGLPCVATRIGGVVDVVRDGRGALLVPQADAAALAAACGRMLRDDSLRHALGEAAEAEIRGRFGLEARVATYRRLYAEVAGATGRVGRRPTVRRPRKKGP